MLLESGTLAPARLSSTASSCRRHRRRAVVIVAQVELSESVVLEDGGTALSRVATRVLEEDGVVVAVSHGAVCARGGTGQGGGAGT